MIYEQSNAAWAINHLLSKEYYIMYESRQRLFELLWSLEYICRGLEDPQKICRNAIEKCKEISDKMSELDTILAPFNNLGFKDKYEEK